MMGKVTDFLVKVTIGILFVFGIALIFAISAAGILLFNAIASTANAPIWVHIIGSIVIPIVVVLMFAKPSKTKKPENMTLEQYERKVRTLKREYEKAQKDYDYWYFQAHNVPSSLPMNQEERARREYSNKLMDARSHMIDIEFKLNQLERMRKNGQVR